MVVLQSQYAKIQHQIKLEKQEEKVDDSAIEVPRVAPDEDQEQEEEAADPTLSKIEQQLDSAE